jgi:hypothetical protein
MIDHFRTLVPLCPGLVEITTDLMFLLPRRYYEKRFCSLNLNGLSRLILQFIQIYATAFSFLENREW